MNSFSKLLARPDVGAVAILHLLRSDNSRMVWMKRLFGNASWLLLLVTLGITWSPLPKQIEINSIFITTTLFLYLIYILLLEFASRKFREFYESHRFRLFRVSVNLVIIGAIVWFSSAEYSYFWFFFVLPIFQTIIYLDTTHVFSTVSLVITFFIAASIRVFIVNGMPLDWTLLVMNSLITATLSLMLYWLFGSARNVYQIRENEMEALGSTARDFARQKDRSELLQTIIHWAVSLAQATGGGIYEYDFDNQELVVIADYGGKSSISGYRLKPGHGMAGKVIQTGQSLIVDDYSQWAERADIYPENLFRAVAAVPLTWQGRILGVLYVTDDRINKIFTEQDSYLLELLASQAAIAMLEETRRRAGELERKTRQLRSVQQIGEAISAAPTLHSMLQEALILGLPITGSNEGSIMLVNPKTKTLDFAAWIVQGKVATNKIHREFKYGEGIAGHVAETRKGYICEDTERDGVFEASFTGRPIRSLLCVPILSQGRVVGTISADSDKPSHFSEDDLQFLSSLANHLATALETFYLREIGTLVSNVNTESLKSKIVEIASILTGAEFCALFLVNQVTSKLERVQNFPPDRVNHEAPRPNGLANTIVKEGNPLLIKDAQNDPRVKARSKQEGIASIMGVPLKIEKRENQNESRTIGVLMVSTRQQDQFGQRDQDLLESLASQIAVAIDNAQLFKSLKQRSFALEELYKTSLELTQYKPIPELLQSIIDRSVKLFDASGGGLYLLDNTQKKLKLAAVSGMSQQFVGSVFEVGQSVVGQVVLSKEPFWVSDYQHWPHRLKGFDNLKFTAVAGTPIMWHDKIWGVLTVRDSQEGRNFSPDDIELLELLGNLAAFALENARQHDESERVMENAIHAIMTIDENGYVRKCNEQAGRLLGYSVHEMIGKSVTEFYDLPIYAYRVKQQLTENELGRISDHETYIRTRTGERIDIRLSAAILSDYEGTASGSVGFFRDIREVESDKRQIERLTNLLDAGQAIVQLQEGDLPKILNTLVNKTKQVLNCDLVSLYIYDPDKDHFSVPPVRIGLRYGEQASTKLEPNSIVRNIIQQNDIDPAEVYFIENSKDNSLIDGDFVSREEIESSAICILKVRERITGVLFCNYRQPHSFKEEEKTTFRLFANMSAIAIENARLFHETKQRAIALEGLHQVSLDITGYQPTYQLVDSILQRAVALLNAVGGVLYLLDESGQQASIATVCNLPTTLIRQVIPKSNSVTWQVIHNRQPLCITNYHLWENRLDIFEPYNIQSVAGAPIANQDKVWGAIVIHTDVNSKQFDDEALDILANLADLAAIALENARRTEELERLMDSTFDAVIAVDMKGKIIKFNRRAEEIFGFSAKDLIGQFSNRLYHESSEASRIHFEMSNSGDDRLVDYDTQMVSKEGEIIPIRISRSLMRDIEGNLVGSVGFFRDQREIQRLEDQIQAVQMVNVTFILLSRWLHKAKQTAIALQTDVDALENELPINLFRDILARMKESLFELSLPSQNLGKNVKSGLKHSWECIDMGRLIERQGKRTTNYQENTLPLTIVPVIDGSCLVMGSELLLETAVEMLLENAIESIRHKRLAGKIEIACRAADDLVHVTIKDSGTGIPHSILKDLYHKSVTSDNGFGYGSFTIANILRAHKGDIQVVQTSAEGTEIAFYLPQSKPEIEGQSI